VTGRAEIMNSVHEGGLGGTYGGNPVAAAAALGSIATMRELNLADRARHLGEIILGRFDELAGELAGIGDVRGRGAMCALELVVPGTTDPDPVATKRVAALCHQQGVVVLTCGTYGNVVRLLHHWSSATTCSTRASVCWRVRCARCSAPDSGSAGETRFG